MPRKLPLQDTSVSPVVHKLSELGLCVRNQRAQNLLRIDDTAALCGVSGDLLSRLENGKPVTSEKLLAVLQTLGLHMVILSVTDLPWFESAWRAHHASAAADTPTAQLQSVDE